MSMTLTENGTPSRSNLVIRSVYSPAVYGWYLLHQLPSAKRGSTGAGPDTA
jgi:hypothetical protein